MNNPAFGRELLPLPVFHDLIHGVTRHPLGLIRDAVFSVSPGQEIGGRTAPEGAVFAILHEGSNLGAWFAYEAECYNLIDRMVVALNCVGLMSEQDTSYLSWVFRLDRGAFVPDLVEPPFDSTPFLECIGHGHLLTRRLAVQPGSGTVTLLDADWEPDQSKRVPLDARGIPLRGPLARAIGAGPRTLIVFHDFRAAHMAWNQRARDANRWYFHLTPDAKR